MIIIEAFSQVIARYIDLFAKLFRVFTGVNVEAGPIALSVGFKDQARRTVEERLAMIDKARDNLVQGIQAIDELKSEAEENRVAVQEAISQLSKLELDRANLEQQRDQVKRIVAADVAAFQQLAGVPTPERIRKERIIGFLSGVLASTVASGLVWLIVRIVKMASQNVGG